MADRMASRGKMYAGCSHWLVRLLSALAFIAVVVFIVTGYRAHSTLYITPKIDFGFLVDAGSHGSRIQLFTWPKRVHDPMHPLRGPITIPEHVWQFNTDPGISSQIYSPNQVGHRCIKPLIDAAKEELERRHISKEKWSEIPLYIKATAGMRDVGVTTRSALMWSIRDYLAINANNPFAFKSEWARVTAGEEEGVYGWLTVNTVLGTWNATPEDTVGSLDLGGASAQITFFPMHTSVMEDYYSLVLGNKLLRLYSHSYLGFGWGDALMRLTTRLGVEVVLAHIDEFKTPTNTSDYEAATKIKKIGGSAGPVASNATNVVIDAVHPCFSKGHEFTVDMPSLAYPDGRFYVDISYDHIVQYMKALGIHEKDFKTVEKQAFIEADRQKHFEIPEKEKAVDVKSIEKGERLFEEHVDRLLNTRDDMSSLVGTGLNGAVPKKHPIAGNKSLWSENLQMTEELEADDDDEIGKTNSESDDVSSPIAQPLVSNTEAKTKTNNASLPDDVIDLTSSSFRRKAHKKESNHFADVVYQDTDGSKSLYGSDSKGPFHALSQKHFSALKPKHHFKIRFHGGSDYQTCKLRAQDLFFSAPCFIHSCSFQGVYQPRLETSKFLAFGQYSKVQSALGLDSNAALGELEKVSKKFCSLSKSDVLRNKKEGRYKPFGKNGVMALCWKSTWAYSFLTSGLQFHKNSTQIKFAQTVGEAEKATSPGWGLGSMIYEVNFYPWTSPIGIYSLPFAAAAIASFILAILSIILACHIEWFRKMLTDSDGYVSLA